MNWEGCERKRLTCNWGNILTRAWRQLQATACYSQETLRTAEHWNQVVAKFNCWELKSRWAVWCHILANHCYVHQSSYYMIIWRKPLSNLEKNTLCNNYIPQPMMKPTTMFFHAGIRIKINHSICQEIPDNLRRPKFIILFRSTARERILSQTNPWEIFRLPLR